MKAGLFQPLSIYNLVVYCIPSFPSSIKNLGEGANLGPVILIFAPCLLFVKRVSPTIKKIFLFAAIYFFLWNATFIQVRFLYPAIVLLLIVSAYALSRVSKNLFAGSGVFMAVGAACYIFLNFCMGWDFMKLI